MAVGRWVDTGPLNVAAIEFELLDHWSLVGVSYTRFTNGEACHSVRALLTGIARQGGRFVPARELAGTGGEALRLDADALVQYLIDSRATQPRQLSDSDQLTYTRGDAETMIRAVACQDIVIAR